MTFDEYKELVASEHPKRVQRLLDDPTFDPYSVGSNPISEMARKYHLDWGFKAAIYAIEEAMPKSDKLTLFAWSKETLTVKGCTLEVVCKACHLDARSVHFELSKAGEIPLPMSGTGFKSIFILVSSFADKTPYDYINHLFEDYEPQPLQLALF